MDWWKGAALLVGGWLLAEVAGELLRPILRPVGRLYTRAYSPPHGVFVLIATYVVAIFVFRTAPWASEEWPGASVVLVLGAAILALIGTLVFRDQRRAAAGLPPVRTSIPSTVGVLPRAALSVVAVLFGAMAVLLSVYGDSILLEPIIAFSAAAVACSIVAVTGRVPWFLRMVFDSDEGSDGPSTPPQRL